jgi:hypothetical protein
MTENDPTKRPTATEVLSELKKLQQQQQQQSLEMCCSNCEAQLPTKHLQFKTVDDGYQLCYPAAPNDPKLKSNFRLFVPKKTKPPHFTGLVHCVRCQQKLGQLFHKMGSSGDNTIKQYMQFNFPAVRLFRGGQEIPTSNTKKLKQALPEVHINYDLGISENLEELPEERKRAQELPVEKERDLTESDTEVTKQTKLRSYQREMVMHAMQSNIICCLPTGAGKTLVACAVVVWMKKLNPEKKILVLVDKVPLVVQQAKAIRDETGAFQIVTNLLLFENIFMRPL